MKIKYAAYQCHLFGTSIYLYFNPYCLANILREWSCMHGKYSEVLICWPDSAVLLGWGLHCWMAQWIVHWGAWVPGSKTPIQANCSGKGSFFSSCRAWHIWCCSQFEKKASWSRPGIPTINQRLIFSKQLFNVHLSINKYWIPAMRAFQ